MHRSSRLSETVSEATKLISLVKVEWSDSKPLEAEWLSSQPTNTWTKIFEENGFLTVHNILEQHELEKYKDIYDKMISGEIDTSSHRHDLGNHESRKVKGTENICQIMWPSVYVEGMTDGPFHQRSREVAKLILGKDMEFDFDMALSKGPHTGTPTPWHQDQSYWLDMPDKRAVSCWCALDDVFLDNGCMWYVPGSHKLPLRPHRPVKPGCHVLTCQGSEEEGKAVEMSAGSCTFHHGKTVHYSRPNITEHQRRAFVTNFRPAAMVDYERQRDYDHGQKGLQTSALLANTGTHIK